MLQCMFESSDKRLATWETERESPRSLPATGSGLEGPIAIGTGHDTQREGNHSNVAIEMEGFSETYEISISEVITSL